MLREEICNSLNQCLPNEPIVQSFEKFIMRRHEWCSSGSSGGKNIPVSENSILRETKGDKLTQYKAIKDVLMKI